MQVGSEGVAALGSSLEKGQALLLSAFEEGLKDAESAPAQGLREDLFKVLRAASRVHRETILVCLEACISALVCVQVAAAARSADEIRSTETALHTTLLQARALAAQVDLIEIDAAEREAGRRI